jgi:hypothetical protein
MDTTLELLALATEFHDQQIELEMEYEYEQRLKYGEFENWDES